MMASCPPPSKSVAAWCLSPVAMEIRTRLAFERPGVWEHSQGVANIALALAAALSAAASAPRMPSPKVLQAAAELHDVGKLQIPSSVLNAPRVLTPAERALVDAHAAAGAEILRRAGAPEPLVAGAALHHHRYDGHGTGEGGPARSDLPVSVRLLSIADALEAMTSPLRLYRRPLDEAGALAEIARGAGGQFDPHFAEVLVSSAPTWPLSVWAREGASSAAPELAASTARIFAAR